MAKLQFPSQRIFRLCVAVMVGVLSMMVGAHRVHAQNDAAFNLCLPSGYVLGFFNGVGNDPTEAAQGMERLMLLTGDTFQGERITSELFYNTSGKLNDREGVTRLEEMAETFRQHSNELGGVFAQRWEYFWQILGGGGDEHSLWQRLVAVDQVFADVYESLEDSVRANTVELLTAFVANPPTAVDYPRQNARIQGLVTERKKLLLVAHSQGNLFLDQAYQEAIRVGSGNSVKVVHIASAAPVLHGSYTTADIDLVIGALRGALGNTPVSNLSIPFSNADKSGHKLVRTYLDSTRAARAQVQTQMQQALVQLQTPNTQGETGFFTVTLTWDGYGDVDLHAFEPSGQRVYYGNRSGQSGRLDTDNIYAYGPEHYYASCDARVLLPGVYRFGINNYARATGRTATVQLSSASGGELLTRSLDVGEELGKAGDLSPIPVFDVRVEQAADGSWHVSPI